jgi:hypothetical protein
VGRASLATSPKMESSSRKLAAARNFRAVKLGIEQESAHRASVEPQLPSAGDSPCRLSFPVFVVGLREQLQAKVFDVCAGSYIVCECFFCRVLGLGL